MQIIIVLTPRLFCRCPMPFPGLLLLLLHRTSVASANNILKSRVYLNGTPEAKARDATNRLRFVFKN